MLAVISAIIFSTSASASASTSSPYVHTDVYEYTLIIYHAAPLGDDVPMKSTKCKMNYLEGVKRISYNLIDESRLKQEQEVKRWTPSRLDMVGRHSRGAGMCRSSPYLGHFL
jgi:hypothetical protein